jgi:hypothetical protein
MTADWVPQPEHQAPSRPASVCWLADLRAYSPDVARALHPIRDPADHREWVADPDVAGRRVTD